jgi:ABC-type microcin C transport system duplicated ATPase subunit YejF
VTGLVAHGLTVAIETPTGTVTVVDGVDLSVAAGRCTALVGESGSGKTLTALSLVRLLPTGAHITAGRVDLHGADGSVVDVTALDDAALRRVRGRRIAMIFQEPMTALNPLMRIHDQVGEGLEIHQGLRRREARSRATARALSRPSSTSSCRRVLRSVTVAISAPANRPFTATNTNRTTSSVTATPPRPAPADQTCIQAR